MIDSSDHNNLSTRLPHRAPMLMLTEVVQQQADNIHCRGIIRADNPMLEHGQFPATAAIEPLAQAAGLLLGERTPGEASRPGAIVQIKTFQAEVISIPIGAEIQVHARYLAGSADAAMFEGEVSMGSQTILSAELMIALLPEDAPATTPSQAE